MLRERGGRLRVSRVVPGASRSRFGSGTLRWGSGCSGRHGRAAVRRRGHGGAGNGGRSTDAEGLRAGLPRRGSASRPPAAPAGVGQGTAGAQAHTGLRWTASCGRGHGGADNRARDGSGRGGRVGHESHGRGQRQGPEFGTDLMDQVRQMRVGLERQHHLQQALVVPPWTEGAPHLRVTHNA